MPRDTYLKARGNAHQVVTDARRAAVLTRIISNDPTSVTLQRGQTVLAAQSVAVFQVGGEGEIIGPVSIPGTTRLVLAGTKGHTTLADFNVERDDRLTLDDVSLRVTYVQEVYAGVIFAFCDAVQ